MDRFGLMKRKAGGQRPDEVSLGTFSLAELPDHAHLLRALSRESIASGEAERIAENVETTRRAATKLRENEETIVTQTTQVVTAEIGESVPQPVQDGAKQFIDGLASSLEHQGRDGLSFAFGDDEEGVRIGETEWRSREGANAIAGTISRDEIDGSADATVAIFPTRISGLEFFEENNAWGFVRVCRNPDYAVFYVAGGPQEIRYVAEVKEVAQAEDVPLSRDLETYTGHVAGYEPGDQVVVFEPGTLYELEDPVPYEEKAPRSRVYTDLEPFRRAATTKDAF